MKSDKELNFKKIAERRTQNIIDNIRLLSNCSNTNNYSYSENEVSKIFRTINEEIRVCKSMFTKNKKNKKFKL